MATLTNNKRNASKIKLWKQCEEETLRFLADNEASHTEVYEIFSTRRHDVINKKAASLGVAFSKKRRCVVPVRERLRQDLEQGFTNREIAVRWDVDERVILTVLKVMNIKRSDAATLTMRRRVNSGQADYVNGLYRPIYDVEYFKQRAEEIEARMMNRSPDDDIIELARELRNIEIKIMCLEQEFKQSHKYINDDYGFIV